MIRYYCADCLKYVRLYREATAEEERTMASGAGSRMVQRCENLACRRPGSLPRFAIMVPSDNPWSMSDPLIEATHDDTSGPRPGYRPSLWRRMLRAIGIAGLMAMSLGAQDLSTLKGQEFSLDVFPPCEPKQRGDCTHDADTPTVQVQTRAVGGIYKIRLRGVDAPELEQPRGREAMAALFRLLGDTLANGASAARVYVEGRDKYGRTLGVLYTAAGADVNLLLVANGYAWVDDGRMPKARRRQLEAAQATARERKLGLWADHRPIKPSAWRKGER